MRVSNRITPLPSQSQSLHVTRRKLEAQASANTLAPSRFGRRHLVYGAPDLNLNPGVMALWSKACDLKVQNIAAAALALSGRTDVLTRLPCLPATFRGCTIHISCLTPLAL